MPTTPSDRVVWIVDDSPLDAERARRVLEQECRTEVFSDGAAALERLASAAKPPAVLVLDWVMPGVSGVEVCRFLRASQGGFPQVGILLLTAQRSTEQIVEGLSAGANDFLAKPFEDAELRARVESLFRARELLVRVEEAEALSRELLHMAPDALVAIDSARNIEHVNERARELLQHRGSVRRGTPLKQVLPELEPRLQAQRLEGTLSLPDVKLGERAYAPTLRKLPAGTQFDAILSLHDVTELRRLAARRLDFYSIIAHDLRSPLTTLTLRTQLILGGQHGELATGMRDDLTKMDRNLKSMVAMINDFLDLARLDNVSYELHSDTLDLTALAKDTLNDLAPVLQVRDLQWKVEADSPVYVVGDARRLHQVLVNLIANAVKFTPNEGTIITRLSADVSHVEVSVIDTGRGIPADEQATLFERYTRATVKGDDVQGTGLGLLIVREIIEAHGGSVGVESRVGHGSRFWFRLPGGAQA